MEEREISINQLSEITGINKGNLSRYVKGETEPRQKGIYALAKALNVDEAWLMGMTEVRKQNHNKTHLKCPLTLVPIYSCISCGRGTWIDENPEDYAGIPDYMMFSGRAFANPAEGDSMEPGIHNGDLLIFQESPDIPSGCIGSFSLNGSYYCKRFKRLPDGSCWLFSDNTEYDPIPIRPDDNFRILGIYKLRISKEQ